MTCTTFLHESELNVPTTNIDINSMLVKVRHCTGEDWQIIERQRIIKSWVPFRAPTYKNYYEVYKFVGGCGPWQVMNFYNDDSESSINFGISANTIVAYLMGILVGMDCANHKMPRKLNESTSNE